jgi:hypothetical protein
MGGVYKRDIVAILQVLKIVEVLEGSESRDNAMLSGEDLTRFKSYEEYRKDFDERQKTERILGGRGQDYPLSREDFWRAKEEQDDAKMWSTDKAMLVKLTEGSIDKKGNNIVIKRPYAKSVSMSIEDAREFVKDLINQSKVLSPEFISFSLQVNSSRSSQAAAILSVLSHEAGLDDITTSEGFRRDYAREEYERVETVKDQSPNKEKLQAAKRFLNNFNRALNQIGDSAMLTEVITSLEETEKDISQKGEIYNRTAEEYDYIAVSDERIEAMLESTRLRLKAVTDELSRLRSLPKEDYDKLVAVGTGISGALSRYFTALDNLHALRNGLNAQRVFSREINDKHSEISYAINDLKIKLDSMPISDAAMLTGGRSMPIGEEAKLVEERNRLQYLLEQSKNLPLQEEEQARNRIKEINNIIGDKAMLTSDRNEEVGGIDFNPAMLEMQIKRDGNGLVLPVSEQPILNMNIEGLVPIIINVLPVTVPMLLGELEDKGTAAQLSRVDK